MLFFNSCFTVPITDSVRRELHLSATARGNHMSLQIALSLPSSSLERSKFQPHFCFPMNIGEMVCYLAFISTGPMFVFYYNTTLFFACLEKKISSYFAKFLSLKVLLKRQLSRWAALVELSHTPPLLSHWALPRQKFPTWEMMIYISISLPDSLHHPIHFATAGPRCASLRKTLSHF